MLDVEYDFVVIGVGLVGCVVVDGLFCCGCYSVLLIEVGGVDCNFWIKVFVGYVMNFRNCVLNWVYYM